jgi:DNA polymerase-3 subunit beta
MKLITIKSNFKKGLNIIERLTGKNLTLPILNNILLKAEKNTLILKSTDLEIGAEYRTMIKIEEEGKITIPAKILSGLVNFLPDENIEIEVDEKTNTLSLSGKNNKSKIKGLNADDFPIIPQIKNKKEFIELNSDPFLRGILKVLNFCSIGQTHPELSGIYFNFQKDKLELVSTDSFRLAKKDIYYQEKKGKNYSFILPQKAVREVANIISETNNDPDYDSKMRIYFEPNQIFFDFFSDNTSLSQFRLTSRLIEGDYPNYQEIIPTSFKTQIILDKNEFLNQIKTTSLFSGNTSKIDININPEKESINFFAQNVDFGESKSSMKGKVKGEKVETSFNFKYLIDGISNIEDSNVVFELNRDDGPALLKSANNDNYVYILMPIKA